MSDSDSSSNVIPIKQVDFTQRFLFENMDVRGEVVKFEGGLKRILEKHNYPEPVAKQLGEFLLASILLSTSIKFEGRLILQVGGKGPVSLMMAECSSGQDVRGIAKYDEALFVDSEKEMPFSECFAGATLAITIEPHKGERYQGIVPLNGDSLSDCLAFYFEQSEQLSSDFYFAVEFDDKGEVRSAGMLLQQLPVNQLQKVVDVDVRQEQWNYVTQLSNTLTDKELINLPVEEVLHRLYHEDDIRLFEPTPVNFACSCSRERYLKTLCTLDKQELQDIVAELGSISVTCEFCNQHYEFTGKEVGL